jgi:hypothetical protein
VPRMTSTPPSVGIRDVRLARCLHELLLGHAALLGGAHGSNHRGVVNLLIPCQGLERTELLSVARHSQARATAPAILQIPLAMAFRISSGSVSAVTPSAGSSYLSPPPVRQFAATPDAAPQTAAAVAAVGVDPISLLSVCVLSIMRCLPHRDLVNAWQRVSHDA